MLEVLEEELEEVRHGLLEDERQLRGEKVLAEYIYGVGKMTGLALTAG